jgi:hypothetical protein
MFIPQVSLCREIEGKMYRVKISQDVLDEPFAMAAWRVYGDAKLEWRTEKFFEQFPDEKKYRYTYKEELDCRKRLAEYWEDYTRANPRVSNKYLDQLVAVSKSLYFPEYIYAYFRSSSWEIEKDRFRLDEFKRWKKEYLKGHHPETMIELEEFKL